jgi:sporulation protein YtfJ
MLEHPINAIMNSAMENLKEMVDVNTIVGDAITSPDGTVVIPVSKVSFGLAAGGGEYTSKTQKPESSNPFAGGVGAGVSINPMAFLVVSENNVRLLPVQGEDAYSKLLDTVPSMVNKFSAFINKKKDEKKAKEIIIED